MKEYIITGDLKLAELVEKDPRSLVLVARFGLSFGFGEKTINSICQEKKINSTFFLLMVNVFLNPQYFPNKKLRNIDLELLLTYLANSHVYYIREKIPYLKTLFNSFLEVLKHPVGSKIETFFNDYIQEVIEHIEYEEQVVFPYISKLSGKPIKDIGKHLPEPYGIRIFEERHTNIEDKLSDLKNLLIRYLPPSENDGFLRMRVISELFDLEQDLVNHARLEDQVLIPVVEQMEQGLKT
jgi:regulator of cell morphogenesis and NO signaling